MPAALSLADVQQSWDARDPQFVQLLSQFVTQSDPDPATPIRDGAPTFERWLQYLRSWEFKRKSKDEQRAARVERLKAVEAPTAEVPLPERLKAHEVIDALWRSPDPLARDALLRVIAECPLVYGPWRALKRIFKEAEASNDTEVFGALAARFDAALSGKGGRKSVSAATLAYLSRRAWRYLRRVGQQLPATYADVAVDFLLRYTDDTNFNGTWVLNHIFYHEKKNYGRSGFRFGYREKPSPSDTKHRAYGDLWKRSPRPLFTLLERAHSDPVREFAAAGLKADFKTVLRDVEPDWVIRLVTVPSGAVHDFVVWILQNVPKFEQGEFRTLKLHEPVLRLFDSPSQDARKYAAAYARTHARDLTVDELVPLFGNDSEAVRKLARDLLGERDPRKAVGLEAWGRLLEMKHGHEFAVEVLVKHFGAKELTPEWFADRLLAPSDLAREFAQKHLPKVHALKDLGPAFFVNLVRRTDPDNREHQRAAEWAVGELSKLDLAGVPVDDLRFLYLYPPTADAAHALVAKKKIAPQRLGMDFLKMMAYLPDWDASPWLADFRAKNGDWAKQLAFDDETADTWLELFTDVRAFNTADLGLDWLLTLAGRPEPRYHDFATDRMVRTLAPADFAPSQKSEDRGQKSGQASADLGRKTFLFTGKLKSMTRDEAEAKVKAANGVASGSVTKTLHYLVVGDDGSPLYGQGKKGSKQVKAEELNAAGANIAVISETAFLQMVSGVQLAAADADSTTAGCERLWAMATAPGAADAPLAAFARQYLRLHHKPIAQADTGKAPDPGTEVPDAFLTWRRFFPLLSETRKPLRDFALEFAEHNFARWNPPADDLLAMSEIPFVDVRRFVAKALLADPGKEAVGYRLDPAKLASEAVYRFCESGDEETRALGMELIRRLPKLRVPEELFRLTESPDRKVRAFVIRSLWQVYRDRGLTEQWKPPLPPKPTVGVKAKKEAAKREAEQGSGVPARPTQPPAERPTLAQFLRRVLFELPPGPPEKSRVPTGDTDGGAATDDDAAGGKVERQVSLKPIPARRAKLDAVETMRDLALDDRQFAEGILPLLDEFLLSKGVSERAACLVAVTRVRHKYPELRK